MFTSSSNLWIWTLLKLFQIFKFCINIFLSGASDPLSPGQFLALDTDGKCEEKFNLWLKKSNRQQVNCFATIVFSKTEMSPIVY